MSDDTAPEIPTSDAPPAQAVDGAPRTETEPEEEPLSQEEQDSAFVLRRRLHHHDLYGMLGLRPGAPVAEVERAIERRRAALPRIADEDDRSRRAKHLDIIRHVLLQPGIREAYLRERAAYAAYTARERMGRPMERIRENVRSVGPRG
ncbi:MAG TPA: hypothetical protein VNT51_08605 [Miltoncostaeaceae bacterium]|nr:hypothetical protein [Miltoncostaeaceae bacterium]